MNISSRSSVSAVALVFVALFLKGSTVHADTAETMTPPQKTTLMSVPIAVGKPRLLTTGGMGGVSDQNGFELSVDFVNAGKESVTIVGIGRSGPGLKLLNAERRGPYVLLPGESIALQLKYRVTNCKTAPRGKWPVPLRVLRPKGEETVYLDRSIAGTRDTWLQGFVKHACSSR
ncbi:hypothetical protein AB0C27_08685 [Nonomuraea sp. NPDC048882]|uniref:hypothetical protein n=1 Tax=Nonomuraea sp. NPDC048882 TaxID=3154347 RepID=UPI0033C650BD